MTINNPQVRKYFLNIPDLLSEQHQQLIMSIPQHIFAVDYAQTLIDALDTLIAEIKVAQQRTSHLRFKTNLHLGKTERDELRTHVDLCNTKLEESANVKDLTTIESRSKKDWTKDEKVKLVRSRAVLLLQDIELRTTVTEFDQKVEAYDRAC